jgi:hypothetical protein
MAVVVYMNQILMKLMRRKEVKDSKTSLLFQT